ncbi:MAG: thioesterase family protein, partial [Pseudomonadota bacterium]|nr:thioesterase family protein [Pseudomonadota bacterium]
HQGARLQVQTQVLAGQGKKLHLFHMLRSGDQLVATVETLLLHVDLKTRRSCPPAEAVEAQLQAFASAHAKLPTPEGVGRAVGQRP